MKCPDFVPGKCIFFVCSQEHDVCPLLYFSDLFCKLQSIPVRKFNIQNINREQFLRQLTLQLTECRKTLNLKIFLFEIPFYHCLRAFSDHIVIIYNRYSVHNQFSCIFKYILLIEYIGIIRKNQLLLCLSRKQGALLQSSLCIS